MSMRIPMFFKFLAGCMLLVICLLIGFSVVIRDKTKMKNRGNYLEKHYNRYVAYQDGIGRAISSVAESLAADSRLATSIQAQAPADDEAPSALPVSEIAAEMFEAISHDDGIKPDLMVLFDRDRNVLWASPGANLKRDDLRKMAAVSTVLGGSAFFNRVVVHGDDAVQLTGVPVTRDKDTIGGLFLGIDVLRYFEDAKVQSDPTPHMQYQMVLVQGGKVVESVMDKSMWPELDKQLLKENWGRELEGDIPRDVINLENVVGLSPPGEKKKGPRSGKFDFYVDDVRGFTDGGEGIIGQLFLLRSRTNLKAQEAVVPWTELTIGAVFSVLIAMMLAAWISRPIKRFVRQSHALLEGGADLNQRIDITTRDETRDLANNINRVFDRLYQLAAEVQGAAFQVGASSAEISAASKHMLDGLTDQTFKIESSTAAVTELSASIQQVAANAVEATQTAEKSNVAVTAAVSRMQTIRGTVEEAADKMAELGESSKRIGNIVEVIRQISEQTSLLALNASIEAAHAGEQGRGFAVVADEVSSLAQRVGQSAKDIETLIQTIKEQTAAAAKSMEAGTREVEGGTLLVTNTLKDLQSLINVVKDTASAVQEQAVVSDEIARNMDAVQKIASEMVAGSEEAVQQGQQLHGLAVALEHSVGEFNIDGNRREARADPKRALGSGG